MSLGTVRPVRSAAWRISLWGTIAFAFGTLGVFLYLQQYVASDIQRRTDAWLTGEIETLRDVAARTPKGALYGRIVRETAEMASHEIPGRERTGKGAENPLIPNDDVFFLIEAKDGSPVLWVGGGSGDSYASVIRASGIARDIPVHLRVAGARAPFRVAATEMPDGGHVYLGVSERDELRVLRKLRIRFLLLWLLNVGLGFGIIFWITREMLGSVRKINAVAAKIGEEDLRQRVPMSGWNDEVTELAGTLNRMLERIETSVHQLHTITNSLAHDLRSPLTAIRARLEMVLGSDLHEREASSIVCAIDEIDHLTEILSQSLDVAEAQAGALRMEPTAIELEELVRTMIELYQPSMDEKGLQLEFRSVGPVEVWADAALLHRVVANLLDNELKHLPASRTVTISLGSDETMAELFIEDDGPGFEDPLSAKVFARGVKGSRSDGRGLGLAFVEAVVGVHGGTVSAANRPEGGASIVVRLPRLDQRQSLVLPVEMATATL